MQRRADTNDTNDPFSGQGLPASVEAERSILGAILLDNNIIDEEASLLKPESYFLDSHRRIRRAMSSLRENEQPIDLVTLRVELQHQDDFERIGGSTYLSSLIDGVPRTDTIAPYAKIVKDKWFKRRLLNVGSNITAMVFDDETDYDRMLGSAEQYVYELSEENDGGEGPRHVATVAAKLTDFYEAKRHDRSALIGISTGFKDINVRTLGLTEGVIVVAARPQHGKTSLVTNIGTNLALEGKSVYMASIESSAEKIVQRILASMSGIDSYLMRQGRMHADEWRALEDTLAKLAVTQFVIDDTADLTPDMLISRGRRHKNRYGLDLAIVDHIHEMDPGRPCKTDQERIRHVMTGLRRVSRILHVPVLAAAQFARSADDRPEYRPQLKDLAESASIERVADVVIGLVRKFLYTNAETDRGLARLVFMKQRDGSTEGDVHMAFIPEYTRFEDLAFEYWPKREERKRRRSKDYYNQSEGEWK